MFFNLPIRVTRSMPSLILPIRCGDQNSSLKYACHAGYFHITWTYTTYYRLLNTLISSGTIICSFQRYANSSRIEIFGHLIVSRYPRSFRAMQTSGDRLRVGCQSQTRLLAMFSLLSSSASLRLDSSICNGTTNQQEEFKRVTSHKNEKKKNNEGCPAWRHP